MALPLLRELASARQSCHLAVYQGGRVVVIAQVESPERWSFGLKVGVSMGLTDTSSGHVLLAFRDEVERTRMLAAHIKVEGELESDPGELFAILAEVRQRGCASMPSRQIRGITSVAYRDGRGRPCDRGHQRAHIERIDQKVSPTSPRSDRSSATWPSGCRRLWGTAGICPRTVERPIPAARDR